MITEKNSYNIKTTGFQGPLDLLLNLIAKHEIDIYDVSISEITQEYIDYINKMKEFNLEIASEFLLIAATLLEIKSARLLPVEKKEEVIDELSPEQVRRELIKRLINYRKFKNASVFLEQRFEKSIGFHPRNAELEERFLNMIPDFSSEIDTNLMAEKMVKIIQRYWLLRVNADHITPITISINDQIEHLNKELLLRERVSFKDLTSRFSKIETIVTFLAILELFKKGEIDLGQAERFGDIEISKLN